MLAARRLICSSVAQWQPYNSRVFTTGLAPPCRVFCRSGSSSSGGSSSSSSSRGVGPSLSGGGDKDHVQSQQEGGELEKEEERNRVRICKRIVAYDKRTGEYVRCGTPFTEATNAPDACNFHLIGYFAKVGSGNWFNCCGSPDPRAPPCLAGPHSDMIDDAYLRGHSIDPTAPQQLLAQQTRSSSDDGDGTTPANVKQPLLPPSSSSSSSSQ